jgi:hypothetical protein
MTLAIEYQKRLPTLSASTDTNAFTTHGQALIAARVQKVMNMTRYRDIQTAEIQGRLENEALERLMRQTDKLVMTGRIVPD